MNVGKRAASFIHKIVLIIWCFCEINILSACSELDTTETLVMKKWHASQIQ